MGAEAAITRGRLNPNYNFMMCLECWQQLGSPRIDGPQIRSAVAAIAAVYQFSGVGGNLHLVLDDYNLRDEDLAACATQVAAGGCVTDIRSADPRALSSAQRAAEQRCLDMLQPLTIAERASALALFDDYWSA